MEGWHYDMSWALQMGKGAMTMQMTMLLCRYDVDGTIASMWNSQREFEGLELSELCGCGACTPCLRGDEHRHHMSLLAKQRLRNVIPD